MCPEAVKWPSAHAETRNPTPVKHYTSCFFPQGGNGCEFELAFQQPARANIFAAFMAVPKATVNENRNAVARPSEIGPAWEHKLATPARDLSLSQKNKHTPFRGAVSEASYSGHQL